MTTAALLLLVSILLVAAVIAGTVTARQARRLPTRGTPGPTGAIPSRGGPLVTEPGASYRQRPRPPAEELSEADEDEDEDDPTYRAVMAALEAHSQRADRKALYSNILFFAAGVLASILTTLLIHPL